MKNRYNQSKFCAKSSYFLLDFGGYIGKAKKHYEVLLSKKITEGILDAGDLDNADGPLISFHALEVVLGDDDGVKAQFLSLGHPLFTTGYLTDLSRESHLASETHACVDGHVHIGGQDGTDDRQIQAGVVDLDAAHDIEEDILLGQFEAQAFL